MEKTKAQTDALDGKYLDQLIGQLGGDNMSVIDFDELMHRLTQLRQAPVHPDIADTAETELAMLKDDCEKRIGGMIKAMAALDRKGDSWEGALATVDELPSLDAAALLKVYRHTCARFRDCFPTHSPLTAMRPASASQSISNHPARHGSRI